MRNLSKLLFQRVVVVSLGILLQILFVVAGMDWLREYWHWVRIAMSVISWVAVLTIMTGRSNPSYKMAWVVLILAFPVAGITIYLLFGGNRISDRENRRMARVEVMVAQHLRQNERVMQSLEKTDIPAWNHARYLLASSRYPVYDDSQAVYFPSGERCFARMLEELEQAEHYIFLEFFIINNGKMWDAILDVLRRKAMQGVDVRVMYDGTNEFATLPASYPHLLAEYGIKCRPFAPLTPFVSTHYNFRDHRKILVIDGKVAFTGGINLSDRYINIGSPYGHWKDTAIMLRGRAVDSFTLLFLQMWNMGPDEAEYQKYLAVPDSEPQSPSPGWVIPYGDSPLDSYRVGEMVYSDILNRAERYVHIMTPYLILDGELETALRFAAQRGVDVELILPGIPDKPVPYALAKTHYAALLEAGVRIYEYTPGFVHAKVFVSDDCKAVVGSINLDYRSLYHHFECAAYMCDTPCIKDIEEDFISTRSQCREVTQESLKDIKWHTRLLGSVTKAISTML